MKIQVVSDIHLEYYTYYPGIHYFVKPIAHVLVLAGDICYYKHKHFLTFFQEASFYFKYVVFVPGNHEYYTSTMIDTDFKDFNFIDDVIKDKLKHLTNVKVLQKGTFVLNNIKFIGTTLWYNTPPTDQRFNNIVPTQNDNFILYNNHLMPHPKPIHNINRNQYNWLVNELNHSKNHCSIVITHYLPSKKCIASVFKKSFDNYLFYTECDEFIEKANIWIYGHTHIGQHLYINNTIVMANPMGLPKEQNKYKDYKYNKEYVIDVPSFSSM